MIRAFSLAFCVFLATSPMALSQSLGLGAGFVELGQTEPEHGEARQSGRILMDFTISAHHGIEASAALSVAEFDEWQFRATASELSAGLTYHVPRTPLGLEASVIHDRLDGPNGAPAETRLRLGLFIQFGPRPSQAEMRPFQISDPIAQVVRRGL